MNEHDPKHIDILTHMLGAGSHIKKRNWGYRNRFCAEIDGDDYRTLLAMEELNLVVRGQLLNGGTMQYFYATEAGCNAIGLNAKQRQNAMSP